MPGTEEMEKQQKLQSVGQDPACHLRRAGELPYTVSCPRRAGALARQDCRLLLPFRILALMRQ